MPSEAKATLSSTPSPRGDRDRFVALAFCWADFLIELDDSETVTFAAGPTEALLGRTPAGCVGLPVLDLVDERDRATVSALLSIARKQGRFDSVLIHLSGSRGRTPGLDLAGYRLDDMVGRFYLALRLAAPVRSRDQHGQPLNRNPHSGLLNTDSFSAVVADRLKESDGDREMTLLSLQGFDELQQRLDPASQDSLMTALGASLRACSVDGDSASQVADDRYVVLHGTKVNALDIQRQIADLARESDPAGQGVSVETASIGIDEQGISPEDMANGLIYTINRFRSAKGSEFNMRSLSTSLSTLVSEAVKSVQKFRQVVASHEFDVAFQPIVDVQDGTIHHYEALCRFHADEEDASPYHYITFAEETGLIPDFDLAMVGKVIHWLKSRPRNDNVSVAVNVSGHSVASLPYVAGLHSLLKESPWVRDRLVFEITESARMDDLPAANRFIQGLRGQGYEVCLDDFGAGAANFQYLSTLEVDVVKLDGSAVHNAQNAVKGEAFLRALVNLCRNLGVKTIAEMVDDQKGLDFVRRCGVDFAQGYFIGRPATDITTFADNRPAALFPGKRR